MFGKKKSLTERFIAWLGEAIDGHLVDIAKKTGTVITSVAAALVGTSAMINAVRDDQDG